MFNSPRVTRFTQNLKDEIVEQPLLAIGALAGAAAGAAKLIDALSGVQSKRAYAKRMNRKK